VNAGVIIARKSPDTRAFLTAVLDHAADEVPPDDRALYENGHVIHYSKNQPYLQILDPKWNNNRDPYLVDYVRHYSAGGPMRKLYRKSTAGLVTHVVNRVQTRIWKRLRPAGTPAGVLRQRIEALATVCLNNGLLDRAGISISSGLAASATS
jgi:hypothetical protein